MKKKRHTILVVEDEESIRWLTVQTLQRGDYEIIETKSGNEALKILDSRSVDLVLSDIEMADGNGFFLLEKLRENFASPPPLVFISGCGSVTPAEVRAHGALTLFSKPFSADHLLEWIRTYFGTRKHQK